MNATHSTQRGALYIDTNNSSLTPNTTKNNSQSQMCIRKRRTPFSLKKKLDDPFFSSFILTKSARL